MNSKNDPMGRAIADYHKHGKAGRLRVLSPVFEDDEMPLTTLFRTYNDMPEIERRAIDLAAGRTLDVGAAAGCHTLELQQRGIDVTAIDISPLSVQTMKQRGVKNAIVQDFFTMRDVQFDTILMLMNGIGIVGTLKRMPEFFRVLDQILAPGGQVLCDSSEISFVFEDDMPHSDYYGEQHNDAPDALPHSDYYGEQRFTMHYKDTRGEPFTWLYIDPVTLKQQTARHGYTAEIVATGSHYDYLARITKQEK